jgi:hypothetical protein
MGSSFKGWKTERTDVMGYIVERSLGELASALDMLAPKNERGIQHRFRLLGGVRGTNGDNYHCYLSKYVRL